MDMEEVYLRQITEYLKRQNELQAWQFATLAVSGSFVR